MALYDRLLGRDDAGNEVAGKIPIHQFQALLAEGARGKRTLMQASNMVEAVSGTPLSVEEQAELQTLMDTIPARSAADALGTADRALRFSEIDQVLLLADVRAPGYDTPAQVKAKLGV